MFDKILGILKGNTVKEVGDIVDNLSTSDSEKSTAKNALTQVVMNALSQIAEARKSIIVAEIGKGSWLTANWRPITMLCFAWIVMYKYFVAPVFGTPDINLVPEFWQLLKIGVGGYVGGRSLEKIADTVTKNIDLPFLKKKNRNLDT